MPISEDPKELKCWACGGEVEEKSTNPDTIFLHCPQCSKELDRLSDNESYMEELQLRFNHLLKKYERISGLYNDLQDFIKANTR